MSKPLQKILFGSPGTGKSFAIDKRIIPNQLRIKSRENVIKTVFHPEYTYGDFMGKLVPLTRGGKVEYNFYEGHFLRALGQAYKNILENSDENAPAENVVLVIDEINRGNSSAIFGTAFQLLDREPDGWSSYFVTATEIEYNKLLELMGIEMSYDHLGQVSKYSGKVNGKRFDYVASNFSMVLDKLEEAGVDIRERKLRLPPNLSILATMNTSDNSIFFMDSAFKRRWDWEFVHVDDKNVPPPANYGTAQQDALTEAEWKTFAFKLNDFIRSHHDSIRGIEDKQIGFYFIKERPVTASQIQNKLMFFLWDSVFNRDKRPLAELLDVSRDKLVTFGDFTRKHNEFVRTILNR